jgi:hypothetical protein
MNAETHAEKLAEVDELADAGDRALAALPTSADAIAALFDELGIKGDHQACSCPVATYLGGELADQDARPSVTHRHWGVHYRSTDSGERALPSHVSTFVKRFDSGDYLYLDKNYRPNVIKPAPVRESIGAIEA